MKKRTDNEYLKIIYKTEELLKATRNRYRITLQIAHRAKKKKYESMSILNRNKIKPLIKAIIEMAGEINYHNATK